MMKHLGDITKLDGAAIEPVWCVTGGSPCQDLSIAGKRAGLAGARSGLFMEQIRVIKEMRKHDKQLGWAGELIRRDTWCGRTSPERSAATKAETSRPCSRKRSASSNRKPPVLKCLQKAGLPGAGIGTWTDDGAWLGEYTMRNTGECPSVVVESRLSQILEVTPHTKYSLSARACQGILRRAARRGKDLPEMLKQVLLMQSASGGGL